ncbi:hypothetical protein TcasGA2_TC031035 [Tribolium castaneum]|uniref:Uncharacterized protein n=1 Tax=Tribolium castaneum TaxID=7070 RepID=A0A139WL94_TRICA|nr:PREDICTED: uncharacterized protein LOC103312602 [Tribolium castaneum]KYB28720.1 hypothetical protein TcasGA2_TC031035 [Tribolium castaneum]|eukprot:XP_008191859.1 PREDICTED: uncharacterized protein LOC103312602 [Tribolium castaneum]
MGKGVIGFINYWYFRYLLVTELYMVEKWERVMFHIVILLLLSLLSLFNTTVILGLVSWVTQMIFFQSSFPETAPSQAIHGEL